MNTPAHRFPAETPANLVIKSPIPESNDVPIDGVKLGWTVRQLKRHLTTAHPSKPQASKQRLIYAGRALLDHQRLSDVLRRFEPGITQHIHLVVAGAEAQRPSSGSAHIHADGLRQRRPAPPTSSAEIPAPPTATTSPSWGSTLPAGMDVRDPTAILRHLEQIAATAQQYTYYAQAYEAMGYSRDVVAAYANYASYYMQYHERTRAEAAAAWDAAVGTPTGTESSAAPTTDTSRSESERATVTDDSGEPARMEDDNRDRFAQAGHAADAGFVDRDERNIGDRPFRERVLEQVALFFKLSFFLVYFGSHTSGWRWVVLVILCIVTLLYQGGWIQRAEPPPRRQPGEDDAGNADGVPDTDADDDSEDSEDNEEVSGIRDVDGDSSAETGDMGSHNEERTPVATAPEPVAPVPETTPPRPPQSLSFMIRNIVVKFFISMVPGMLERQVQ